MESRNLKKKFNFIYKTTNLINKKKYVGRHSTNNLKDNYMGSGKILQKAFKKYGISNFSFEILEFCSSFDELKKREEFFIEKECSLMPLGYNMNKNGMGGLPVGFKHSKKTKEKMKETIKKMKENGFDFGKPTRGKIWDEERKKKQGKRIEGANNPSVKFKPHNKGKKCSEQLKLKISKSHKESEAFVGKKNPRYKEIEFIVWCDILLLLKSKLSILEISKKVGINSQRLYRHLFFNGMITYEELPNYLRLKINPKWGVNMKDFY